MLLMKIISGSLVTSLFFGGGKGRQIVSNAQSACLLISCRYLDYTVLLNCLDPRTRNLPRIYVFWLLCFCIHWWRWLYGHRNVWFRSSWMASVIMNYKYLHDVTSYRFNSVWVKLQSIKINQSSINVTCRSVASPWGLMRQSSYSSLPAHSFFTFWSLTRPFELVTEELWLH